MGYYLELICVPQAQLARALRELKTVYWKHNKMVQILESMQPNANTKPESLLDFQDKIAELAQGHPFQFPYEIQVFAHDGYCYLRMLDWPRHWLVDLIRAKEYKPTFDYEILRTQNKTDRDDEDLRNEWLADFIDNAVVARDYLVVEMVSVEELKESAWKRSWKVLDKRSQKNKEKTKHE